MMSFKKPSRSGVRLSWPIITSS
ncbi:MAG: CRISPR-associated protein Cas5 [Proteobacteria bacterium]|nr:CRISPR-associated protein Cas5 [Pseudomonadota bacterium]